MNETTTHTPLRLGLYPSDVFDARGNIYASTYGNKERAAHIVKCVNAHDALVTALRAYRDAYAIDPRERNEPSMEKWIAIQDNADKVLAAINSDKPDHA